DGREVLSRVVPVAADEGLEAEPDARDPRDLVGAARSAGAVALVHDDLRELAVGGEFDPGLDAQGARELQPGRVGDRNPSGRPVQAEGGIGIAERTAGLSLQITARVGAAAAVAGGIGGGGAGGLAQAPVPGRVVTQP